MTITDRNAGQAAGEVERDAERDVAHALLADYPDLPEPGADDQYGPARQGMLFDRHQETATPTGAAAGAA